MRKDPITLESYLDVLLEIIRSPVEHEDVKCSAISEVTTILKERYGRENPHG